MSNTQIVIGIVVAVGLWSFLVMWSAMRMAAMCDQVQEEMREQR